MLHSVRCFSLLVSILQERRGGVGTRVRWILCWFDKDSPAATMSGGVEGTVKVCENINDCFALLSNITIYQPVQYVTLRSA